MTEERKIIRIADAISAISNQQIAIETIVDSDLGFKMWGGKDADGAVTRWLAKDKAIQITAATLTGGTTTGSLGLMTHDTNGLLAGQVNTLAEINAIITDATLFGEEDFDANTILKADSDDTPIALTVPEQTLVGRITAGNIDALSIAEVLTLLDITLDTAYDGDAGPANIDMDAGSVTWTVDGAYDFLIDLTAADAKAPNGDSSSGFKVFNAADYFRVSGDSSELDMLAEVNTIDLNSAGNTTLSGAANLNLDFPNIDLSVGALTLKGTASIETEAAENLTLLPGAGGYTEIGTGGTPSGASGQNDLYVTGILEVDSTLRADGAIQIRSSAKVYDNQKLFWGTASNNLMTWSFDQTPNTLVLGVDDTTNSLIFCQAPDEAFDFAHAAELNPTIFLHSANQSTTEWGSIAHDRTDFVINAGAGTVKTPTGRTYNVTTVNAATYDLLITDHIVHVTYTVTGAVTSLTLPSAQVLDGRVIHIVDGGGNASANNITIDTQGAETISGAATLVIDNDYESYSLYAANSNWYIY